ncbi:LOW QUALITY PROTEIN: uncharacterized protein LOC114929521 [Nylanderia fulva]|uniref:LOW QUALITY PROTEIN: uncharacterized protein LOC114929521 n=1 Tax=Nylanderia fulva TaxID=613905 RepID=UPI0010FAF740|nr:LOW QUALITY PROTEIN: uncharacterized protein LOC114929521 [Nylanderia fulva]
MKEWKDGKDVETLEEGLQQEKQEFISKLKYNTNCCKQWTRCIRLIFLLQLTLFLGWGCYMILQNYNFRVTENETADITRERYLPLVSKIQKSHPTEKMSATFVKPEITDELNNNFLKGLKEPDLMPSKTIEIDVDSSMQTSTQNSISMSNKNIMEASDINNPLMTSSEDKKLLKIIMSWGNKNIMEASDINNPLMTSSEDKKLLKIIMSWGNFPLENSDITFNNNEESNIRKQFLENNIAIIDLNKFAINNDFTENVNPLMLNQEDRAPNAFNEIESVHLMMIPKVEDAEDLTKSLKNSAQDPEQIFLDMSEQFAVQDDHSEKSSSKDGTDEQINASSQSDFVMYSPNQSHESSDMSSEHLIQSSFASQIGSIEESSKKIKNNVDDNLWPLFFNEDNNNAYDPYVDMKNSAQNPEQIFLDMSEQFAVQDDHSEKSSSKDGTDEQINTSSQSDFVIYPPNQSSESSGMSSEHLIQCAFASQIGSIEESSKKRKNNACNVLLLMSLLRLERFNEDKYGAYDSNMSSKSDENFDTRMSIVQDTKDAEDLTKNLKKMSVQDLEQIFLETTKQFAIQDDHSEKSSSKDGTDEQINASSESDSVIDPPNQSSESSGMSSEHLIQSFFDFQDGSILSDDKMPNTAKSSISSFEWLNAPPTSADNLQSGPEDISESNKNLKRKRRNPSLEDTIENTEIIDAFISKKNKIHNQSYFKIKKIDSDNSENDSEIRRQERIIFNALNNFKPADISKYNFNMPDYTFNVNDIDIEKIEDELKYETVQLNDKLLSNKNFDNKIEDVEMHIGI